MKERRRLFVSASGSLVASGHMDHDVLLWDLPSETLVGRFVGHWGDLCAGAFSADETTLATAGAEGTVRVWDVATRRAKHELDVGNALVRAVNFDENALVIVLSDGRILRWVLGSHAEVLETGERIRAACFAGASAWLATWKIAGWPAGPSFSFSDVSSIIADSTGFAFVDGGVHYRGSHAWDRNFVASCVGLTQDHVVLIRGSDLSWLERRSGALVKTKSLAHVVDDVAWTGTELLVRGSGGRVGVIGRDVWLEASLLAAEWVTSSGAPVTRARIHEEGSGPPEPIQFREVEVAPPEPIAPKTREETGPLHRVAVHLRGGGRGYRTRARTVNLHASGTELELREGELVGRLRVVGTRRVELTASLGDSPPPTGIRLARWLRRRTTRSDQAEIREAIQHVEGVRDVRFARSGAAISVAVALWRMPSARTLAEWFEVVLGCLQEGAS
ncbi:MAG: hypothetical protein AAGE52_41050 [Myxococcota bacterium]